MERMAERVGVGEGGNVSVDSLCVRGLIHRTCLYALVAAEKGEGQRASRSWRFVCRATGGSAKRRSSEYCDAHARLRKGT